MALSLKYRRYRSRRPGSHTVTELRAEDNYTLWVRFDDGLEGRVYLGEMVSSAMLGAGFDESHFSRVGIDPISNAVTWEGGINLDPDWLYRDLTHQARAALH